MVVYFWNFASYKSIGAIIASANKECKVTKVKGVGKFETTYKWVGGVLGKDGCIYAIPNCYDKVLKIDPKTEKLKEFGELSKNKFKYTGGCVYKDKIYGFPRASNNLLEIDPIKETVKEIDLGLNYDENGKDHHYSGTLYKNTVYLAPRNANYILAINLDNYTTKKIGEGLIPEDYQYDGAILHYNGLIYFFPKINSQVMVLNPKTNEIKFIGEKMNAQIFGGAIAKNGNIYSFTAYSEGGIVRINTKEEKVDVICKDTVETGFFGTKLASNGKMYGVVGHSNKIYEFDPETETAKVIKELVKLNNVARCAGGVLDRDGNLWLIPAYGERIIKLEIEQEVPLTNHILESVQFSNY